MTQSRWLSFSIWAATTAPVAFTERVAAFTAVPVDRCLSTAVTNHKSHARSCWNKQRHPSSAPLLLHSLFNDDQTDDHQPPLQTRNALLRGGMDAIVKAAAATTVVASSALGRSAAAQAAEEPEITSKCFVEVRIMEPLNEANGYSSKNAFKGRLIFGLYGKACPKAVANFMRYAGGRRMSGEPSYSEGLLTKMEPGVLLEGGKISGLNSINIGGQEELEYDGEVITVPPLLENTSVELLHDRRGLLTREKLSRGPEFGVSLAPAPELDGSHEVFGRLLQGEDVLSRLEKVPVYEGGSRLLEEGSVASNAFKAQNRALVYIGKNVFKDERAVDRTGLLMRRVDIVDCGVL